MQNNITIEQFNLADRLDLLAFLKTAYDDNPRQYDESFWNWHYLKTPHSHVKKMPIWVAKSGDKIAGQLAAIPVKLKVGNDIYPAIWILDFIVAPEFRRQGLGKRLVNAAEEFCPLMLGVNTDEQHAPALLQGLGWKIITKIPRYHKLLFPGAAISEISKIRPLAKIINYSFAPFRPRLKFKDLQNQGNLKLIDTFNNDFDDLWRESSKQWDCVVKRDSEMLGWQYAIQPDKRFDILGYYEKGKLLGYAILFFRKRNKYGFLPKAAITDILYHPSNPSEIVDKLLEGALQLAVERRTGGLVTDVLDALIEEKLKRLGFWQVKNPLQLMAKSIIHQESLYDLNRWFLTRGDADISIFENPNI